VSSEQAYSERRALKRKRLEKQAAKRQRNNSRGKQKRYLGIACGLLRRFVSRKKEASRKTHLFGFFQFVFFAAHCSVLTTHYLLAKEMSFIFPGSRPERS
jgi:hypothetical protein